MKKPLTARQQLAFDKILDEADKGFLDRSFTKANTFLVHQYYKLEWHRKGFIEGTQLDMLKAIEKKGWIKLEYDVSRQGGLYNPRADSYGYGSYQRLVWAEIL